MTTSTVPMTIVCPDWCQEEPEAHAAELWNHEGMCLHAGAATPGLIEDATGLRARALAEPTFKEPVSVLLYAVTWPDGRESASPSIFVNDTEITLEQAEQLAAALTTELSAYRAWKAARS